MKIKTLLDLYTDQLRDMHSSEKQLTRALPKLAKSATNPELRKAFEAHLAETKEHVSRVEGLLTGLKTTPGRKVCAATEGLVAEGGELIEDTQGTAAGDAALILAAQKCEHYEILTYGCLAGYARLLGRSGDVKVIEKTLAEERAADEGLSKLAHASVNEYALGEDAEAEQEPAQTRGTQRTKA